MRHLCNIAFLFFLASSFVFAQSGVKGSKNKDTDNKASVFIKAEGSGKNQRLRLRLFNNTKWAIAVGTFSYYFNPARIKKIKLQSGKVVTVMPSDKEIDSLYYFTERERIQGNKKVLILGGHWTHSYNNSWIGPKDSIFFSIPEKDLRKGTELYISFKYEWELNEKGVFLSGEPQHRVYFRRK